MAPRERPPSSPGPLFLAGNHLGFLFGFCLHLLVMSVDAAIFLHLFPTPSGWRLLGMALVLGGLFEAKRHIDNIVGNLLFALRDRLGRVTDAPQPARDDSRATFEHVFPTVDDNFKSAFVLVNDEDRVIDNRMYANVENIQSIQQFMPFPTRVVALRITRLDRQA